MKVKVSTLLPLIFSGYLSSTLAEPNTISSNNNAHHSARSNWQQSERYQNQQEKQMIAEIESAPSPQQNTIINEEDLTTALFMAINSYNWELTETLLDKYQSQDNADESLVLFAQASLARGNENYEQAEKFYKQLLEKYPDFVRGQLDLARTQFDNYSNISAKKDFSALAEIELPPTVNENIKTYHRAIEYRQKLHGSMALGIFQIDNLNESSQKSACLLVLPNGTCGLERDAPDKIKANGIVYETALKKRVDVADHHGILLRTFAYGQIYKNHKNFNEHNLLLSVGYSFQNNNKSLTFAPLIEYSHYNGSSLYRSIGLEGELSKKITNNLNIQLYTQHRLRYYYNADYQHNDGKYSNISTTLFYQLSPSTSLFTGINWSKNKTDSPINSKKTIGLRLGLEKQFDSGINLTLAGEWNLQHFDAYNPILEVRQKDKKQTYSLTLDYPEANLGGFYPSLSFEHTRNKSNADWVYSYQKNSVFLKLNKQF